MLSVIICKARLLFIPAIVFNLAFQGVALSVHLSTAHHSPDKPITGFHISLPADTEDHHPCPVCRILTILHPSLALGLSDPMPDFPLHAEKGYTRTCFLFHADTRIYDTRAPPCQLPVA